MLSYLTYCFNTGHYFRRLLKLSDYLHTYWVLGV